MPTLQVATRPKIRLKCTHSPSSFSHAQAPPLSHFKSGSNEEVSLLKRKRSDLIESASAPAEAQESQPNIADSLLTPSKKSKRRHCDSPSQTQSIAGPPAKIRRRAPRKKPNRKPMAHEESLQELSRKISKGIRGYTSAYEIYTNDELLHIWQIFGQIEDEISGRRVPGYRSGKKHAKVARRQGVPLEVTSATPLSTSSSKFCELCRVMVPLNDWNSHLVGRKHKSRETFTRYKSAVEEAEADKNGVSLEGEFDFGFVEPNEAVHGAKRTATVSTTVPKCRCVLTEIRLASSQGQRRVVSAFSVAVEGLGRNITPGAPLLITLRLKLSHIGRYEDRVELLLEDTQLKKCFLISRSLKATVGNKDIHEALRPKAPYVPRQRNSRTEPKEVVEGVKPLAVTTVKYAVTLPKAAIPGHLMSALTSSDSASKINHNIRRMFMPNVLNSVTYAKQFKYLLWIEEFKMEQALIVDCGGLRGHSLPVPGLAEKRPSVLVGDRILVQEEGATDGRWFEGHVHVLRQAEVGLCFHSSFARYGEGRKFQVRFKLNQIPTRRQHQAMDTVFAEERVLFPTIEHLPQKRPISNGPMKLFNSLISTNPRQLQAVASIVHSSPGSLPFVVFGPPGTGKTITIVEAIKQLILTNPNAKILACAPSNSAADLITSRLRNTLQPEHLFRFYAASRFKNQVPDELLPYTYSPDDQHFSIPGMFRLRRYRVVVATCVSGSFAFNIGLERGHFTHIFIDEAGQATEPETFVSIKTLADSNTNIILSGDPKQLGPIIRSPIARDLGLETSYIERLMSTDTYDIQAGYGKSVIKLVQNFRSHQSILSFPNERFYGGELQRCASPNVMNKYLGSSLLPNNKFPIIFHSVSGKDDREASSPSFFNVDEILQVKSYVQRLRDDRKHRTTDADIGIIAPYHAQCVKLRSSLRNVADGVKIGSVEEFQGQERPVIIISTVRSSKEFVEYDLRHTLGFVANPRRFNVAVTRAQALLIIVGDPQVLSLDPLWRSFLNYIYLNGGWNGPDITWDPDVPVSESERYDKAIRKTAQEDMNDFARQMEEMTLKEVNDADDIDANVDKPWRDME
ncbi:hypothetical protein D9619_001136 [Psilocybe cf. subviscida]|uniref:RNA helicase n=1 Tax=Psilocybe cf. subviscida TaxID=2480587 RepID=A0A8H5BG25_9AGAR|nr:hypothetical protein D9619_001136 [Psilocybe cf. subviscida]